MTRPVILCSFTALDDVPKKLRGDAATVLRALEKAKRFSCFEVDGRLGGTLNHLIRGGFITTDHESVGYPWTKVEVTAKGYALIAADSNGPSIASAPPRSVKP